ncbi:hypothetical protein [Sphingopyxis sp.]|uniref:hypothetical protein n=1 Tax=Sphingopyxis sp. TaxID=1908224 RepID=UPI0025EC942E|nr:hypothetical protein [Sphingopyxis sp.]MBK6414051.1 hypothetical protein [Sphingopyxis sp.]
MSIKIDIERHEGAGHINISDRASGRLLATLDDGDSEFVFSDEAISASEDSVFALFGVPAGTIINDPETSRAAFAAAGITALDVRMIDGAPSRDCDA